MNHCPACSGLGYLVQVGYVEACPGCNGRGVVLSTYSPCRDCKGTGERFERRCRACAGRGTIVEMTALTQEPIIVDVSDVRAAWADGIDALEDADEFNAGVLAALYALIGGNGRLLRALSEEGTFEIDGTGIWLRNDEGMAAKIVEYEREG